MAWEKALSKLQYDSFVPALNAGMAKLNSYYECSAESDAHIMAMSTYSHLYLFAIWLIFVLTYKCLNLLRKWHTSINIDHWTWFPMLKMLSRPE